MFKYGVLSGLYFPVFGLNTGKYGPEKTPYLDTFHVVSDSKIELQRKNVVIHYLNSQLNFKSTDNSLSSSVTRNLNDTSNQDFVGHKLIETSHSNVATKSKHKNPTIKSSRQQSKNSEITRKILVAGNSMLNNIHERGLSKQHTVKAKNATTEISLEKSENLLESKQNALKVHAGINDLPKNINPLNNLTHFQPIFQLWRNQVVGFY